ncbi:MAG: DUF5119 domain-containing protein [Rikenellaceae bacterium]
MKRGVLIILMALCLGCKRRDLSDTICQRSLALIPVEIDWSQSSITPTQTDDGSGNYIHKVTLRFFPKDGSAAFDKYLEKDIYQGDIEVPIGEYSVVAFNEAIYDTYWHGVVSFVDTESYSLFAAELAEDETGVASEALKLASWSLDDYEVTQAMVNYTQGYASYSTLTTYETQMLEAFTPLVPQPLTCYTSVSASITNLASVYQVTVNASGLAKRVFMASGDNDHTSTTHYLELTSRTWNDDDETHGVITSKLLTFSHNTSDESSYQLEFDVILVDGSRHTPDEPLIFDVSHQISRYASDDIELSAEFEVPLTEGGIGVDDWEDEEYIILN